MDQSPPQLPRQKAKPAPGHFRFKRVICRWWWLALLVIALIVGTAYKTPDLFNMRGPLYESTALLEVKPIPGFDRTATPSITHTAGTGPHRRTSPFLSTQQEILQATASLELAIQEKDLINRLGGSQTDALKRMQKSLTVRKRYGTDLIEISYRDEDPKVAQDAVTAIYESYTKRRAELEMSVREEQLKVIRDELDNKNHQLADLKEKLVKTAKDVGITFEIKDGEVDFDRPIISQESLDKYGLYSPDDEIKGVAKAIDKILDLEGDDLVNELIGMAEDLPFDDFRRHCIKYDETKMKLLEMKAGGLSAKHPDVVALSKVVDEMKDVIDRRALQIRLSLKHKLDIMKKRVKKVDAQTGLRDSLPYKAKVFRGFNATRKEYSLAQVEVEKIQSKYDIAKAKLARSTLSIMHENPQLPTHPVTKGRNFFTTLFTLIAIPCATIAALITIYLAEAIFPRRTVV